MEREQKKAMLCPECRKLISKDEPACPYCGLQRPASLGWLSRLRGFSLDSIDIVKIIIYINGIFFVLSLFLNPSEMGFTANPLGLLAPSDRSLFVLGGTGVIPVGQYGRFWTLLSASFLHGGILHIFFNMTALFQLGPFVIQIYGTQRFIVIYILAGAAGFILSLFAGVAFTIGASASICGLIGAILYYGKSRGGFYGQAIYKQAMGWILGLAIFGLLIPGINNWAHGGGVLAGIMLGFLMGYDSWRLGTALPRMLCWVCILLTAGALLLSLLGASVYLLS
jgi:rhomboid protease GluP